MAAVVAFLATVGSQAQAGCSCVANRVTDGTGVGNANLTTALSNNTVCVAKSGGGWEHQEQHKNTGALVDFKLGTNPVDPTTTIGTWSIANSQVTYSYVGATAPFTYSVCSSTSKPVGGSTIGFCPGTSPTSTIDATIKAGITSC